ncbi:hypothetical protein [Streptomyces sp. NBC_01390]
MARETGAHLDTVRTWRVRFADGGPAALTALLGDLLALVGAVARPDTRP